MKAILDKAVELAFIEAKRAFEQNEVPIGAVVFSDSKIIGSAHNLVETNKNPLHHAEMLAIDNALALHRDKFLGDLNLYVTLEPCPMCAQAISFTRLKRVYFGASDPKGGGIINGAKIFNSPSCHFSPEIYPGIHEEEAAELLQRFFQGLRK
jgi:tRNA(adenine34) deaminase